MTYEDRKRQEEIYRWVKDNREKGYGVKAGQGRIFYKGTWRSWEESDEIDKELRVVREKDTNYIGGVNDENVENFQ